MVSTHMIVLPGGGYAEHAPHEGEPVARWLTDAGVPASVFRYPRTPTYLPGTPTASPPHWRPATFPTQCTCSPTARTASAWPAAPANPRSGPPSRMPGFMNKPTRETFLT
jgi:hypothetical protein